MRRSPPPHGPAFTLLDLLVVIPIIAILAALSLPALSNAKLRAYDRRWLDAPRAATATPPVSPSSTDTPPPS